MRYDDGRYEITDCAGLKQDIKKLLEKKEIQDRLKHINKVLNKKELVDE